MATDTLGSADAQAALIADRAATFNLDPPSASAHQCLELARDIFHHLSDTTAPPTSAPDDAPARNDADGGPPDVRGVMGDAATKQSVSVGVLLESLKHISRTPHALNILSAPKNVSILASLAEHPESLKTLCNIALQHPPSRLTLASFPFHEWFAQPSLDTALLFLQLRLAFLATVDTDVDKLDADAFEKVLGGDDEGCVTEGCKLLFNVAMRRPEEFKILIPLLVATAKRWPASEIVNHITHVLVNFRESDVIAHIRGCEQILVDAFERSSRGDIVEDVEQPFLMLFTHLCKADTETRHRFKAMLAPDDVDRSQPMGEGTGAAHTLVRFLTAPLFVKMRPMVEELLVTLFEGNVEKLSQYTGLGSSAGLLVNRTSHTPSSLSTHPPSTCNPDPTINPITGAIKAPAPASPLADLTEEEKEREAEKLMVLFDRLNKTGVIKLETKMRE